MVVERALNVLEATGKELKARLRLPEHRLLPEEATGKELKDY